jgi:hypothetical protein
MVIDESGVVVGRWRAVIFRKGETVRILVGVDDKIRDAEWQVDWPAIEAKAVEENWTFYRQVFVTVLAVLTIGWVFVRGRRK